MGFVSILMSSGNKEIFIFLTGLDVSILLLQFLFVDMRRFSSANKFVVVFTNREVNDVDDRGVIDDEDKQFEANEAADDLDTFDLEIERDIEFRSFLLE
jgi:hypothetical protein